MLAYRVIPTQWSQHSSEIRSVRKKVFIEEQGIPETLEWDGKDTLSQHVLALTIDDHPIGTARITSNGQIGRMCVLPQWRKQKVGEALLRMILTPAEILHPFLNAQLDVVGFYQKYGFEVQGSVFHEAGIAHQHMVMKIS